MLIVDDAATVRLMIADHVRAILPGVEIVEAASATEGITAFEAAEHDVTFLDGVLADGPPSLDVLQAMLAIRPRARVVLTSARPREHPEVVEALGVGAYAYLAKPVKRAPIEEIFQRVEGDAGRLKRLR